MSASPGVRLRSAASFVRLVAARFDEDRCIQVAGSLTFTTLLALVPLVTIAFALVSAFPVFEEWSNQFKVFILTSMVPEVGGKVITVYMQQFAENAARLTAIGVAFLALTAVMLMVTVEREFNTIWRVRRERSTLQRLLVYWTVLTSGPVLLGASLSLTSWLVTQSMGLVQGVEGAGAVILEWLPIALNAAAFGLVYLVLPNRRVRVADAAIGGLTAALAFEMMKHGFGVYITRFPTYTLVYGAFATVPIFLLWLYLSWLVILLGAVVVAVLPQWRIGAGILHGVPGDRFPGALRILNALGEAHVRGETPTQVRLSLAAGLTDEETDRVLQRMESGGWVRRVGTASWVLAHDLATLRVAEVYRLFVFRAPEANLSMPADPVAELAGRIGRRIEDDLALPVKDLFAQGEPALRLTGDAGPATQPPARKTG